VPAFSAVAEVIKKLADTDKTPHRYPIIFPALPAERHRKTGSALARSRSPLSGTQFPPDAGASR
jgi:hypothetical protein